MHAVDDCAAFQDTSLIKWCSGWGLLYQYGCILDEYDICCNLNKGLSAPPALKAVQTHFM